MTRELRRKVGRRLLAASIALATVAGGATYFLQQWEIDRRVLALALAESHGLVPHVDLLSGGDRSRVEEARRRVKDHVLGEHVVDGHFVVIEVYDLARDKVLEVAHPAFAAVERVVDTRRHAFMLGDRLVHTRLRVDGDPFIQVFAPLQRAGRTVAYFEGVYRVAPEALRRMDRELVWSVLLVVVVVLVTAAVLYPVMLSMNRNLVHLSDDLAHANMGMLAALGSAVARRDRGTSAHNYRVTIYAIQLAEAVGLSPDRIRGLIKGAFLHDVGKIGITDAILRKPGRLTAEEVGVMQAHVHYGVEIVDKFEWLADAVDVVQHHHEKVDGTGYPAGLRGAQIPVAARIFAIVDVFDALTTRRPYKEPASLEETMRILEAGRGRSFDPRLLDAFASLAPELHRTICDAGEPGLARTLDRLLVRYFSGPPGTVPGRRGPPGLRTAARAADAEDLDYLSGAWSLDSARRQ